MDLNSSRVEEVPWYQLGVRDCHWTEFAQAKAIYEHLLGPMGLAPFRAEVNLLHT